MNQIPVIKITKTKSGETRRNMTLPENIWNNIVANGSGDANVEWEKRKVEPVVAKEVELVKPDVELVSRVEEPAEEISVPASPAAKKGTEKAKSKNRR